MASELCRNGFHGFCGGLDCGCFCHKDAQKPYEFVTKEEIETVPREARKVTGGDIGTMFFSCGDYERLCKKLLAERDAFRQSAIHRTWGVMPDEDIPAFVDAEAKRLLSEKKGEKS